MAYTAHHGTAPSANGTRIGAFFARLGESFLRYAERQSRTEQIARLEALSDAELGKLGLTREGIVGHVFRDKMYL